MATKKNTSKKSYYRHREDAEWLTREICDYYYHQAQELAPGEACDVGIKRTLRMELQQRFDIDEIEAINILNGFHIGLYVNKYERMRVLDKDDSNGVMTSSKYDEEFLDWIQEKEEKKAELDDFSFEESE